MDREKFFQISAITTGYPCAIKIESQGGRRERRREEGRTLIYTSHCKYKTQMSYKLNIKQKTINLVEENRRKLCELSKQHFSYKL